MSNIKDLKFSKTTSFRGRNGMGIMTGLQVANRGFGDYVSLYPISSRGVYSDAAWLEIPLDDLPAVISELQKHLPTNGTTFAPKPEKTP